MPPYFFLLRSLCCLTISAPQLKPICGSLVAVNSIQLGGMCHSLWMPECNSLLHCRKMLIIVHLIFQYFIGWLLFSGHTTSWHLGFWDRGSKCTIWRWWKRHNFDSWVPTILKYCWFSSFLFSPIPQEKKKLDYGIRYLKKNKQILNAIVG